MKRPSFDSFYKSALLACAFWAAWSLHAIAQSEIGSEIGGLSSAVESIDLDTETISSEIGDLKSAVQALGYRCLNR